MSDGADLRGRRRARWAVAMLLVGFVVAFVPGLAAGDEFLGYWLPRSAWDSAVASSSNAVHTFAGGSSLSPPWNSVGVVSFTIDPTSMFDLATTDIAWAISLATLVLAPVLFVWWRRAAIGFGRIVGVGCCVASAVAVCALVLRREDSHYVALGWMWRAVPVGAALMAAAFLVAPPPRPRDDA